MFFQLSLLAVAVAAASYARALLGPLLEPLHVQAGFTDNQLAVLQGPAQAWPLLAFTVPIGLIIDRGNRAQFLLILGLINLAGTLVSALAPGFGWLLLARCVVGLATIATLMTFASLVADLFPPAQRGRAGMLVAFAQSGAIAGAFALVGHLLVTVSVASDAWRRVLMLSSIPLLLALPLLLGLKEPRRYGVTQDNKNSWAELREVWGHRRTVAPLVIATVMVAIADQSVLVWAAPLFSRNLGLPADRVGSLVATCLLVCGIVAPLCGGLLADFCQRHGGPRRTMGVLALLVFLSAPAGIFGAIHAEIPAAILLGCFVTVGGIIGTAITPVATIVVPSEIRAVSIGLIFGASAVLGLGLAPLLVSALSEALGGSAMLGHALSIVCVASSLCAVWAFLHGRGALGCRAS